jgi:hypothetical protein
MTFIRRTEGRDRGHVQEFNFLDAQEMLAKGQALPVDMSQPDALAFRELPPPAVQGSQGLKPAGGIESTVETPEAVSVAAIDEKHAPTAVASRNKPIFKRNR